MAQMLALKAVCSQSQWVFNLEAEGGGRGADTGCRCDGEYGWRRNRCSDSFRTCQRSKTKCRSGERHFACAWKNVVI